MPDQTTDPLAFLSNPALSSGMSLGAGATSGDQAGAETDAGGANYWDPPPSATPENSPGSNSVYVPKTPDYLSAWSAGLGAVQKMMKMAYTPDDSETVKRKPDIFPQTAPDSTTPSAEPGAATTAAAPAAGSGYYNTKEFLKHGQDFVTENDRIVGNAGTVGSYDKTGEVTVRGTEFGEVDNPSRGGYTEPGWNRGAWGDAIAGENTEGVALPASVLSKYGDWHQGHFGNDFNSKYDIVVTDPKSGKQVLAPLRDAGPGPKTGAGIDLLWGTRSKLGLPYNSSYSLKYSIVPKGSAKQQPGEEVDGHKPIHPTISLHDTDQDGVSLPHSVVKNSIGDFENDPEVMNDLLKGYYKVAVQDESGERSHLAPIVATYGSDMGGDALHLMPKTAQRLNTGGRAKVGYQIFDNSGYPVAIKGYHPDVLNRINWDDHIGPNRRIAGTGPGKRFSFQKYNVPTAEGGYLKPDGTTDLQLADADKAADQNLSSRIASASAEAGGKVLAMQSGGIVPPEDTMLEALFPPPQDLTKAPTATTPQLEGSYIPQMQQMQQMQEGGVVPKTPVLAGEAGSEKVILPSGKKTTVGKGGPEVVALPPGSLVIPHKA